MSHTLQTLLLTVAVLAFTGCDSDDPVDTARQFTVTVENVGEAHPVLKSGSFGMAPLMPGESASFDFTAGPGTNLSFASMFAQSNDLFYAFEPEGLPLYDGSGNATTGDVTSQLLLWDAGTEVNEEPGVGPNQAPRQPAPDTGPDENSVIQRIDDVDDGYTYPATADVIRVTLAHDGDTGFSVTIENVGEATVNDMPVLLSPGAWAAHMPDYTFFEVGAAASEGLERIAEDGDPEARTSELADVTGLTVPLSPGAYAVHTDGFAMFEVGSAAPVGIERIAEDGDPMEEVAALAADAAVMASGAFDTPEGASEAGPIEPGDSYSFTVDAMPGDRLSLATMFVQSNDYYYAFGPDGLDLFPNGTPVSGDQTAALSLYDAGTEGDEEPGVGPFQAPRQPAPNTGPDGEGTIVRVGDGGTNDGYTYPPTADIIRVTITPQ